MGTRAHTYPRSRRLIIDAADQLTVLAPSSRWEATISGLVLEDARAALAGAEPSERLLALGRVHPGVRAILEMAGEPHSDGTAAAALRLGGFGTLFLELVGRCNERCVHCYASSSPDATQSLTLEICGEILEDASALGFSQVQFTGGDPLLCSFLPELVQRAVALGLEAPEIYTNGLALGEPLLERLAGSAPRFAFSFYSARSQVHDAITRTPGSHQRTANAIRRTVSRGLRLRVGIIAMAENENHIEETVDYVRSLGVEQIAVTPSSEVGRGSRFSPRDGIRLGNAHTVDSGHRQLRGKLCVTYEGKVVPCIFHRDAVIGDVYQRRLRDIARAPEPLPGRFATRDRLLDYCHSRLQCADCKLVAAALEFAHGETNRDH